MKSINLYVLDSGEYIDFWWDGVLYHIKRKEIEDNDKIPIINFDGTVSNIVGYWTNEYDIIEQLGIEIGGNGE